MQESRSTATIIADLLMTAPAWARVGLTAPTSRMRREAVAVLADHVSIGLIHARDDNLDQLSLPL